MPGATHVPVLAVSVSGSDAYRRRPERWRAVIDDVVMAHARIVSAERFFETLEVELVMTHDGHTREDAQRAIFRYIETVGQPETTALHLGVRQSGGIRCAGTEGRVVPFNYASTLSG